VINAAKKSRRWVEIGDGFPPCTCRTVKAARDTQGRAQLSPRWVKKTLAEICVVDRPLLDWFVTTPKLRFNSLTTIGESSSRTIVLDSFGRMGNREENMTRIGTVFATLLCFALFTSTADARGGGSGRVSYGGGHHTVSHGGYYVGGSGSSHRGGSYRNYNTGNRYGTHQ
jgi:hypothetical protein